MKIILCKKISFSFFFFNKVIYLRKEFNNKKNFNKVIVSSDLFSVSDSLKCEHEAACIKDIFIQKIIKNKKIISSLKNIISRDKLAFYFGKQFTKEAAVVLKSFRYAEKIYEFYNFNETVYIWPHNISLSMYKNIYKLNILNKNIKIHPLAYLFLFFYNFIKYSYFFIKSIFIPEFYLIKLSYKSYKENFFKVGVYLNDGYLNILDNKNNKFIDNHYFKNDDIVFINDKNSYLSCEKHLIKKNCNLINKSNLNISKYEYLTKIYFKTFRQRAQSIFVSLIYPWNIQLSYETINLKIFWDSFFFKSHIENIVFLTEAPKIIHSDIMELNKSKVTVVYLSTTEKDMLRKDVINNQRSYSYDFMHIIADYFISSKFTFDWISEQEHKIKNFLALGPCFTESIRDSHKKAKIIKSSLNINDNKTIISFFDNTVGYRGVLTEQAYKSLLISIKKYSIINTDKIIIFKSKFNFDYLKKVISKATLNLLLELKLRKNFIYLNETDLNQFEVLGISDLVVSSPLSSILFESILSGKKTIIYDPLKQYYDHQVFTKSLPKINAHNYEELIELISMWLAASNEYLNEYLISNFKISLKALENNSFLSLRKTLSEL